MSQRDMFKKAIIEAMYEKYDSELSCADSDLNVACSKKHYLKLSMILGFTVGNNKSFSKRILVGILIAALLLTGCTAYVYRNEIKEFFVEIYEKHIRITYDNDNKTTMGKTTIEPYRVSYMPNGYEQIDQFETPIHVSYTWQDSNGNTIDLQQKILDGRDIFLDAEHGESKIINYKQYEIYCRKIDNYYHHIWNDGDYAMTLVSTVEISDDELFKIIEGFK